MMYLSGAGAAMQQGQPIGPALNKVTGEYLIGKQAEEAQTKRTQSYMQLMKSLLGKGVDFKSDAKGKATISMEDFNLSDKIDKGPAFDESGILPSQRDTGILNPSASPVGGADLTGLTTEDVSKALQFKFMQEEIGQKKFSDMFDMLYKTTVSAPLARAQTEAATPSITMPGTDIKLTGKQYIDWWKTANKDERTAAIKNYEYAQTKKGGSFKGSFEKFQDSAKTTHGKDYERAVEGGYEGKFNEWMLDMAKAGAIKIDITGREVEKGVGKGIAEVTAPAFAQDVRSELMKDVMSWDYPSEYQTFKDRGMSEADAMDNAQKVNVLKEMDNRIRQAYRDKSVVRNRDGWYIEGKLVVRSPYAK